MKIFKKILMWTFGVALYFNIGWAIGTYFHKEVEYTEPRTLTAKFMAGAEQHLSTPEVPIEKQNSLLLDQVLISLLWPAFIIFLILGSWLGYLVCYILWLVFAGGIAKLFGLG